MCCARKNRHLSEFEGKAYCPLGLDRRAIRDPKIKAAMSRVPRHCFVLPEHLAQAYDDTALPIAGGQSISQPFIVALMTQEARIAPGDKVLEVGTGSGYQAAVLAELGAAVFSIEILPKLARAAKARLARTGYGRIALREGDGWQGWVEEAPFDAILVTASSPGIPQYLLAQLKTGAKLIVPVEQPDGSGEELMVYEKAGDRVAARSLGPVKFVPLVGEARRA